MYFSPFVIYRTDLGHYTCVLLRKGDDEKVPNEWNKMLPPSEIETADLPPEITPPEMDMYYYRSAEDPTSSTSHICTFQQNFESL